MTKIAIAVDGDDAYPIYRYGGAYGIDFGGSRGLCGPFLFESDVVAIRYFQKAVYECSAPTLEARNG